MVRGRLPTQAGRGFGSLSPAAKVLVVNQFGGGVGFFMVLPFLASYLSDDLGYGVALVGLILGLRSLCQQGCTWSVAAQRIGWAAVRWLWWIVETRGEPQ